MKLKGILLMLCFCTICCSTFGFGSKDKSSVGNNNGQSIGNDQANQLMSELKKTNQLIENFNKSAGSGNNRNSGNSSNSSNSGSSEQNSISGSSTWIPVNLEFISLIRSVDQNLRLLTHPQYKLSGDINIFFNSKTAETKIDNSEPGAIHIRNITTRPNPINIKHEDYQSLKDIQYIDSKDIFSFLYENTSESETKPYEITFKRDSRQNLYVFYSIQDKKDKKIYYTESLSGPPPYLLVYGSISGDITVGQTASVGRNIQFENINMRFDNFAPREFNTRETVLIMGRSSLNPRETANYIAQKYPNINQGEIIRLINTYFIEAEKEGVNPDLAIAQMLVNTAFFTNRERLRQYNYAGFNTSTRSRGNWIRNRGFADAGMEIGVKAHIQHLKGYAVGTLNARIIETPRWDEIPNRGTMKTLDEMARRWAPQNPSYANLIHYILNDLQSAQYRQI